MRSFLTALTLAVFVAALTAVATAAPPGAVNQRGDGWPEINGMLLINQFDDDNRPLDARPGMDPFQGRDPAYSCDAEHTGRRALAVCHLRLTPCEVGLCVKPGNVHNKLLGGHGNDTIFAGPGGDVLWGDYCGVPVAQCPPDNYLTSPPSAKRQTDRLTGGDGPDFIYGSKGRNIIKAGAGDDFVKARYGRGSVDCGPGRDTLYSGHSVLKYKRYKIRNCERVTKRSSPGQGGTPIN
jgi:Ca2+-binding RTX toxin-like protein